MSFKYTPQLLKRLEQLLEEAGFMVRYEKGNFNSGYCLLEARSVAVVNRFLNVEGRIQVLLDMLPAITIDREALSGEMQKFYDQLQAKNPGNNAPGIQQSMEL